MAMLYLMRHGSSVDQKLIRGRLPGYPLSKKGADEARKAAEWLADKEVNAVYSSPLQRAFQTAEIIAKGKKLDVKLSEQINEWYTPRIEGKYWSQVSRKLVLTYVLMPTRADFGAENLADVAARMSRFCRAAALRHRSVVCVSHRDCIMACALALTGKPLNLLNLHRAKPGSVTVLEVGEETAKQVGYFEP